MMRLKYFALSLFFLTSLSLVYAWQQVEIIKLAYQQNQKSKICNEFLDRNHYLKYNLVSLKSSSYLGSRLLNDDLKFEIPSQSRMLTLSMPREKVIAGKDVFTKNGLILSLFKIKETWPIAVVRAYVDKQAQAQEFFRDK